MVSIEEIDNYFEKAREEYKKQIASSFLLKKDIEYYKHFLNLIKKDDREFLSKLQNCQDFLKCRKLIINRFFELRENVAVIEEVFEEEENKKEELNKLLSLLKDLRVDDIVEIDDISKEEIEEFIAILNSSMVNKTRRYLDRILFISKKIKNLKKEKKVFDTYIPKVNFSSKEPVSYSNKLEFLLPYEYLWLSDEELEVYFFLKHFEHRLMHFNIDFNSKKENLVKIKEFNKPLVVVLNVKKIDLKQEAVMKAVVLYLLKKFDEVYVIYNDSLMVLKEKINIRDFIRFLRAVIGDANNINFSVKLAKEKEAKLLVISDRFIDVNFEDKYLLVINYGFFERRDKYKEEWNFNLDEDTFLLHSFFKSV